MKKVLGSLLLLAIFSQSMAQQPYLWPIKDASAGANIISAPQGYIDGELNFDNLFIGGKLGDVVVAPADGTVVSVGIIYMGSLQTMSGWSGFEKSFDYSIAEAQKESGNSIYPKYLNGSLGINLGGGKQIYVSGLTGDKFFKTGQKIERGDTLGRVGYSYFKIKEPSMRVSLDQNSKPIDPMSPFGIKSTFIAAQSIKPVVSLTRDQAKEDFAIYINTLKEIYPGLYNVLTADELDKYVSQSMSKIDAYGRDLKYLEFRAILVGAIAKIHDSHIEIYPTEWTKNSRPLFQPQVYFGWINDTLRCTQAVKEYGDLIGKQVKSINGIMADSARSIIASTVVGYDSKVKAHIENRLATFGFGSLFYGTDNTFDMTLELIDGQKVDIKGANTKKGFPKYIKDWLPFINANRHQKWYDLKMLNDSTAYIGLSTFELNQVQVEQIGGFIDSIATVPNLIIDVRNNGGGDVEVLEKLYSYIAGEPITLNGYSKVNKKGNFESFKYSMNYDSIGEIFPEYVAEEGKDGFYQREDGGTTIVADSVINYKGKVYVLTNENSISAATLFPAMLVRNHRGVVVGRETRTAYHFMNALKFAEIRLPNSLSTIRVPLVECVFDTVVNARVPFGSGVLPDYEVPLTLNEINSVDGDAILNHAIKLIEDGQYLNPENPFEVIQPEEKSNSVMYIVLGCVSAIILGILLVVLRRKKS